MCVYGGDSLQGIETEQQSVATHDHSCQVAGCIDWKVWKQKKICSLCAPCAALSQRLLVSHRNPLRQLQSVCDLEDAVNAA